MAKQRHASDELVSAALDLLGNGSLSNRDKIMLALQIDTREDILELKEGMDARLLKDVMYHNVEKGDITRAKKALAKYKGG